MASLSIKALTAKIEALLSKKNARYTECQEKKRRANELLTIRRNIDQVLYSAPRLCRFLRWVGGFGISCNEKRSRRFWQEQG